MRLTNNDSRQIAAFERYLHIVHWRKNELKEDHLKSQTEAAIEIYGDRFAEGPPKEK